MKYQDISQFVGMTVNEILEAIHSNAYRVRILSEKYKGTSFLVYGVQASDAEATSEPIKAALKERGLEDVSPAEVELTREETTAPGKSERQLRMLFETDVTDLRPLILSLREDGTSLAQRIRKKHIRHLYEYRIQKERHEVVRCFLTWFLKKKQEREPSSRDSESEEGQARAVNRAVSKVFANSNCAQKLISDINTLYETFEEKDGGKVVAIDMLDKDTKEDGTRLSEYLDSCLKNASTTLPPAPSWCDVLAISSKLGFGHTKDTAAADALPLASKSLAGLSKADRATAVSIQTDSSDSPLLELRDVLTGGSDKRMSTALMTRIKDAPPCGQYTALSVAKNMVENWLTEQVRDSMRAKSNTTTSELVEQLLASQESGEDLSERLHNTAGTAEERNTVREKLIANKSLGDLMSH